MTTERLVPNLVRLTPPTARQVIEHAFRVGDKFGFGAWGDRRSTRSSRFENTPVHYDLALDARRRLAAALERLGNRAGDREDASRSYLLAEHARLHASIEALERLVIDPGARVPELGGPVIEGLIDRLDAAMAERDSAQEAFKRATKSNVRALRDLLDDAQAAINELEAELSALAAAAAYPSLPDLGSLDRAERECLALAEASRNGSRPMAALEEALRQGATAAPAVARAWVVFETRAIAEELVSARWSRWLEGTAAVAVEAASSEADAPSESVAAALRAGDFSAVERKKARAS